jgi:hypothetical protein
LTVRAEEGSSEGYALLTGQPAISTNIDVEQRFNYPKFLKDRGGRANSDSSISGKPA